MLSCWRLPFYWRLPRRPPQNLFHSKITWQSQSMCTLLNLAFFYNFLILLLYSTDPAAAVVKRQWNGIKAYPYSASCGNDGRGVEGYTWEQVGQGCYSYNHGVDMYSLGWGDLTSIRISFPCEDVCYEPQILFYHDSDCTNSIQSGLGAPYVIEMTTPEGCTSGPGVWKSFQLVCFPTGGCLWARPGCWDLYKGADQAAVELRERIPGRKHSFVWEFVRTDQSNFSIIGTALRGQIAQKRNKINSASVSFLGLVSGGINQSGAPTSVASVSN